MRTDSFCLSTCCFRVRRDKTTPITEWEVRDIEETVWNRLKEEDLSAFYKWNAQALRELAEKGLFRDDSLDGLNTDGEDVESGSGWPHSTTTTSTTSNNRQPPLVVRSWSGSDSDGFSSGSVLIAPGTLSDSSSGSSRSGSSGSVCTRSSSSGSNSSDQGGVHNGAYYYHYFYPRGGNNNNSTIHRIRSASVPGTNELDGPPSILCKSNSFNEQTKPATTQQSSNGNYKRHYFFASSASAVTTASSDTSTSLKRGRGRGSFDECSRNPWTGGPRNSDEGQDWGGSNYGVLMERESFHSMAIPTFPMVAAGPFPSVITFVPLKPPRQSRQEK